MILVKDTDAKSVNAAILALNDDLDKQVKAVKNTNAGIVEGETYNINISGNSGSVKNALTITSTTGSTVYDGSEAKTATIYTPDQEVNKTSSPTFAKISYSGNTGIVDLSSQISWVSSLVTGVSLQAIKVNGVVYLYGRMTYNGSVSIPTQIIGTGLPSAYIPMTNVFSCCEWYSSSPNSVGAWRSLIKTTGEIGIYEVCPSNGSTLNLSISYPVAS